jgi:AraC family ethanolamine operon transcriptional activator
MRLDKKTWSKEIVPIKGPDALRRTTLGSELKIVQLKPGKLRGFIKYFGIGNLEISLGRFNSATRMKGVLHQDKLVLSTILDSAGSITESWKDVLPGNVAIFPTGEELDVIHGGGGCYLTVSVPLPELLSRLASEERLADPKLWNTKRVSNIAPLIGTEMLQRLKGIISGIERKFTTPSDQASDFLQRSIIEPFVFGLSSALPPTSAQTGARLVDETEDYIDAAGGRPIHISELCSALKVSRRSLHRAFADTLGIGPVAYLRSRRLSAIRSVLTRPDLAPISIGDLAFEYGFPETGRFAAYYRAHFGETPSETLRSRGVNTHILNN